MTTLHPRRPTSTRARSGLAALAAVPLLLAACGGHAASAAPATPSPAARASAAAGATGSGAFELHTTFFSAESHLARVVDPQVFLAAPGAPAGTGYQGIHHVAGVVPALAAQPASSRLYNADGQPLGITLGQWRKAAGQARWSCQAGTESFAASFTGLLPHGVYSLFLVRLSQPVSRRFAPLGSPSGTDNSVVATASGTAALSTRTTGCFTGSEAVVLVWHSDGRSHGRSPGVLGVTWHNQVIVGVSSPGGAM